MAKNNFLESANGIQKSTKELLERLSLAQSAVGELLVSVRHSESEMLEKEGQERKAREERERMERLREMLDSDQDLAVHAAATRRKSRGRAQGYARAKAGGSSSGAGHGGNACTCSRAGSAETAGCCSGTREEAGEQRI